MWTLDRQTLLGRDRQCNVEMLYYWCGFLSPTTTLRIVGGL